MEIYDLFLSVGYACRPARHLKYNNLRMIASPLDWQMSYSLDTVIKLFDTSFSSFFQNISEETEKSGAGNNRRIIDETNHIISLHHFDKDMDLKECQQEFINKMHKRYILLNETLNASHRIFLICNRSDNIKQIEDFLIKFSNLYPHLKITLLNVRNNSDLNNTDIYTQKYYISDKLTIVEHTFNDSINHESGEKFTWIGNEPLWNYILAEYRLNNIYIRFKRLMGKSLVIYGAGVMCSALINELNKYNIHVDGIAVTSVGNNPPMYKGIPVSVIDKYSTDSIILIAIKNQQISADIKGLLTSKGYNKIIEFDFIHGVIPKIEDICRI